MTEKDANQAFCKDCKWNKPCKLLWIHYPALDRCMNPKSWWTNYAEQRRKSVEVDPVTGRVKKPDDPWVAACHMERTTYEGCGPTARYFEPKPRPPE